MIDPSPSLVISNQGDRLHVSGEIDAYSAPILTRALAASEGLTLQLDLSEVEFIDSSGLRALMRAHQEREARGGQLRIVHASAVVQRLLEISGVAPLLHTD